MARPAIFLLSAMLYLVIAGGKDDLLEIVKSRAEAVYCGSTLADVLSLVCKGRYRQPPTESPPNNRRRRDSDIMGPDTLTDAQYYFPFLSQSIMDNFLATYGSHRRVPRGVHNECCLHACSYEVLRSYCAD